MKKLIIFITIILLLSNGMLAQVAINSDGSAPHASAGLDVNYNDKGVLIPRMTANERILIKSPAKGLLIFQNDMESGFWYYDGIGWVRLEAFGEFTTPNFVIKRLSTTSCGPSSIYDIGTGVGIGTATPDESTKLDIAGAIKITDGTHGLNKVLMSDTSGKASWQFLTIPSPVWLLTGNTGTLPGINFSGTTDNQAFEICTGNLAKTRITIKGAIESLYTGESIFLGEGSGANDNLADNNNVMVGYKSGFSNTGGHDNTANGSMALFSNTTGWSNVATGAASLYNNTVRGNLVAIGDSALYNNGVGVDLANSWEGNRNSAIGSKTLYNNTNGGYNTVIGYQAMITNTIGNNNTAYGADALNSFNNGIYNTAIGNDADMGTYGLHNATAIGARALVESSNSLILGSIAGVNGATASVSVGIGTTSPAASAALDITSTTQGFLLPRMSDSEMNAIPLPQPGLMVFNTTKNKPYFYNGYWEIVGSPVMGDYYRGGIVFYIDETGRHGLISAPNDQSNAAEAGCPWTCFWTGNFFYMPGMDIGDGKGNTKHILNDCPQSGIAARICDNLILNGYGDWFLPSFDEIYEMYDQKGVIGGFEDEWYWSSSEHFTNCCDWWIPWCLSNKKAAWYIDFEDGYYNGATRDYPSINVRCIREY